MQPCIYPVLVPVPLIFLMQPVGDSSVLISYDYTAVIGVAVGMCQDGSNRIKTTMAIQKSGNIHVKYNIAVYQEKVLTDFFF